jgi:hypothetical protein
VVVTVPVVPGEVSDVFETAPWIAVTGHISRKFLAKLSAAPVFVGVKVNVLPPVASLIATVWKSSEVEPPLMTVGVPLLVVIPQVPPGAVALHVLPTITLFDAWRLFGKAVTSPDGALLIAVCTTWGRV